MILIKHLKIHSSWLVHPDIEWTFGVYGSVDIGELSKWNVYKYLYFNLCITYFDENNFAYIYIAYLCMYIHAFM